LTTWKEYSRNCIRYLVRVVSKLEPGIACDKTFRQRVLGPGDCIEDKGIIKQKGGAVDGSGR